MGRIFCLGFIVFSLVFLILLYGEATAGVLSGIFPITLWFFLTLAFGLATLIRPPQRTYFLGAKNPWVIGITLVLSLLFALYIYSARDFYGAWDIFLLLAFVALPPLALSMVRSEPDDND